MLAAGADYPMSCGYCCCDCHWLRSSLYAAVPNLTSKYIGL